MANSSDNPLPSENETFDPILLRKFNKLNLKKCELDIYVTIEGNISSGKSSFLEHFRNIDKITLLEEQIDLWENFHGFNLLQMKNERPTDHLNLAFQILANLSRVDQMSKTAQLYTVKIMERSLFSSFHVFVKNNFEDQGMGNLSYEILKYNFEVLTPNALKALCNPDLLVYIKTDPKICYDRMKSRNRVSEKNVTLENLEQLHKKHEDWIVPDDRGSLKDMKCSIITINGNLTPVEMKLEAARVLREIIRLGQEKIILSKLSKDTRCETQMQ